MSSRVDIYADIRHHADRAGSKYLHENVVLTAVDELRRARLRPAVRPD